MATQTRTGSCEYSRRAEHDVFDGQPSIERATGGLLQLREDDDERGVELLARDGWTELKRWQE